MPSDKDYLFYILDCLSGIEGVEYRPMMGEYIIYYKGKVIGGIYDDRFLIKIVPSAEILMPDASREIPYETAKPMLLVDDTDNREFLQKLFDAVYPELPLPKPKNKNRRTVG